MTSDTDTGGRRRQILAAALEAFDASGYGATTMDEVAAKAGISKGSIYNYFQSKQDLFEHVFTDSVAPDEAQVDRMLEQTDGAAVRLLGYVDYWSEQTARFRQVGKLVLEFWAAAAREPQDASLAWSLHELHERSMARLGGIVAGGIETGEFRSDLDPHVAAALIDAAMAGILVNQIVLGLAFDEPFIEAFKAALIAALRREPSAPRSGAEETGNG